MSRSTPLPAARQAFPQRILRAGRAAPRCRARSPPQLLEFAREALALESAQLTGRRRRGSGHFEDQLGSWTASSLRTAPVQRARNSACWTASRASSEPSNAHATTLRPMSDGPGSRRVQPLRDTAHRAAGGRRPSRPAGGRPGRDGSNRRQRHRLPRPRKAVQALRGERVATTRVCTRSLSETASASMSSACPRRTSSRSACPARTEIGAGRPPRPAARRR